MATLNYYTPYTYNGDHTAQYRIQIQMVESQNTSNNTTTLTCTAYFRPAATSSYAFNSGNTFTLTVNGATLFTGNPGRVAANAQIGSTWTTSAIAHNYDGTKSITVAVYYNQSQNQTLTINASGTVSLTTIARSKVTVTLNQNGGSGGTTSVQIYPNTPQGSYPSITIPSKFGYNFNGYYTATSGGTQYYNSAGNSVRTFNYTSNTTWYAQWVTNSWPRVQIYDGSNWKFAIPYIYDGSIWKRAIPMVYNGSSWRNGHGG